MPLEQSELEWAIKFIARHGDGDLFPRLPEMETIAANLDCFTRLVVGQELNSIAPAPHRRFIVPKDEVSYRTATQLHPQDSILLTSMIFRHGQGIENRRLPANQVFSYRFAPDASSGLYGGSTGWNEFWTHAYSRSATCHSVLYCDIADFYNQIYHHTVENQLIESGFPNQATKWIIKLLESTTAAVSRGIPIGPHASHLLAEATLIPIDNSLASSGLEMMRYADDMVFFFDSAKAARLALHPISATLDKQQRLILQKHKTKILTSAEFQEHCQRMIEDRPISEEEDEILQLIRNYSGGNPYVQISYNQVSPEDWKAIDEGIVRRIIAEYLDAESVDHIRLRWFYRRLTQTGHPGAVDVSIDEIERLGPCLGTVCAYLGSVQTIDSTRWGGIGARILGLLELDEVRLSPYFRLLLLLLSLFSRNTHLNHFAVLANQFEQSDGDSRREILLAASTHKSVDWTREKREDFERMDPWQKLAFVTACASLPIEERKFLLNHLTLERPFEKALANAIKKA